jgi:hypothetical protein
MRLRTLLGLTPDEPQPPAHEPATLVGQRAHGGDGGTGMTHPAVAADVVDIGREESGRFVVPPTAQLEQELPPVSLYVTRELYGGVRTAASREEYRAEPPFSGGHTVIARAPMPRLGSMTVLRDAPRPGVRQVPVTNGGSCDLRASAPGEPVDVQELQRAASGMAWL